MEIPNKIKIGSYYYNIKKVRIVEWGNNDIAGQINYTDKVIKLRKFNKDEKVTEDILFHEIAHGVLKELEFNYPQISKFRNDEDFTQEFGLNLRKIFKELLEAQIE